MIRVTIECDTEEVRSMWEGIRQTEATRQHADEEGYRMTTEQKAYQEDVWAVVFRARRDDGRPYDYAGKTAGILAWGSEPPAHLAGCRAALFRTRREALAAAKLRHNPRYWPLRIARVRIVITEIER